MKRTTPISIRVAPDIKEALDRAAAADRRSVSSMVEKILADWLEDRGYLPKGAAE